MLTLSPLINSRIKGYVTPKKIEKIAVNIKMLFIDKNDSLEPVTINFDDCIFGSLYANIPSEIRVIKPEKPNRYMPRCGSFANEWTLSIIPERTINAPNKLKANIKIPKNKVHVFKILDFEDAKSECINAVAASHGIRATFSTGSQNQYPPQPSS